MFFVLIGFAGCTCETQRTNNAPAPRPDYDRAIDNCVTKHSCIPLCRDLFQLDPSIQIESCQITKVEASSANVIVRYYDPSTCTGDSGGDGVDVGFDDWSDDGSDDGSTDGSDGSGDGSDTGSDGSDSGSDTGSDDSGGDSGDGSPRRAPGHHEIRDATISR